MNDSPSLLSETTADVERKPPMGQVAVVMAGLALGIMMMGIQLWLLTIALNLYLAGQTTAIWVLALISGLVFLGGILVLRILARQPH